MDCAEAKLQIEPYVAGELSDEQKQPLEEHLAGCAECRLDSELTRASRNPPALSDPDTAPAAFVESIRPDAAAPSETMPAGATGTDGSWTLESIFGAGGAKDVGVSSGPEPAASGSNPPPVFASPANASSGGALRSDAPMMEPLPSAPMMEPLPSAPMTEPPTSEAAFPASFDEPDLPLAQRAAAAAAPLPESDLNAILGGPAPRDDADEPPPSDAPTWDFEPADAKGGASPPEGSLFFAEEALSRSGAKKKKGGFPRLVLWGAGGLVGVGLLALSIWIAMTVRQPLPSTIIQGRPLRAAKGTDGASDTGHAPAPVSGNPVESGSAATAGTATSEPAPTNAASTTDGTPGEGSANAGTASSEPAASVVSPGATPSAPANTIAPVTTTSAASTTALNDRSESPKAQPPSEPRHAAATPKPRTTKTTTEAKRTEPNTSDVRKADATVTPSASTSTATSNPPAPAASGVETATTSTGTGAAPAPAPPATSESAPSSPEPAPPVERPIDRLHLATLNAEQNADLPALRKLRDTWKGLAKTSVGPDRARAKRELADCLWAVQTLTSKPSDQKEALVAYRDYVLNAPAGGADSRTVARMRQLEEAVTESH